MRLPGTKTELETQMAGNHSSGKVPHSAGTNRFATKRTLAVGIVVIAFVLVAMWVPW